MPILVSITLAVVLAVGQWLRDFRPAVSCTRSAPTRRGQLAGVRSDRRVLVAFVASGRAGRARRRAFTARFGTVDATAGVGYELTVIAATVVGGVAIFGGTGSVYGAALGALLLGTITSSLIVLRVEAFWQQAAIGALLLAAIAFDRLVALRAEAALRRRSARRAADTATAGIARGRGRDAFQHPPAHGAGPLGGAARRPARGRLRRGPVAVVEFLTCDSFTTGALDLSEVVLMALPLALVIIAAEIDLSIASMMALSSAVMAYLWNHGQPSRSSSRSASSSARSAAPSTGCS